MGTRTKDGEVKRAFLLSADDLHNLAKLLEEEVLERIGERSAAIYGDEDRKISYNVEFSDGSSLDTSSLDEVLQLPNSPLSKITKIRLSTPYSAAKIRASVRFANEGYGGPMSYTVSGEEREVFSLAKKLDEFLIGLKRWYWPIARYSLYAVFLVLCFALIGIVLAALAIAVVVDRFFFPGLLDDSGGDGSSLEFGVLVWGLLMLICGAVLLLDFARNRWFPNATYAIGQGEKRDEQMERFRKGIITVVLAPFVIGLFIRLLFAWLM